MEGDCEGMVAIVQGLDTTGVTFTICNRTRHNSDSRSSKARIQLNAENARPDMTTDQRSHTLPANVATLANERSSVLVSTSTGTDSSRQHTSSQICDGRYASSYKLAHCMVSPSSPPEAVSEFPPQRKEPCRNQGNFEIGGHGSGHNSGRVRVSSSRVRHYGGSQTWSGSSHRFCKSNRDTEAFAHSLRKYPSMAPFRTASTDLIEKLIRHTQAKNFQEMSRSSKSMRSLRQQKSADAYEMAKSSKHQQTYTRKQDDNVVNNSKVQVGYRGRARNFKLYSPMSDSRNLKENHHRETTFSSSYDYLKAGKSPYGRFNRSDEPPSPVGSRSPERIRSPVRSSNPDGFKSPETSRSPVRLKSSDGIKSTEEFRSPDRLCRSYSPVRFERSVRDLSLSDMSKYIRNTIRQICNERQVVFQVCPKLKNRFNQHKKVCPNKNDRASDVMEDEPEEEQACGSVISRLIQSFSGCAIPSTEQAGCQCTSTDCYCTKATQCVNNPDASTNTTSCSCKAPTKTVCCHGMSCVCANKSQDQAYYNKRIDEEISEWLKDVPVHSIESSDSKKKRETVIKELRKVLKQLPDDENFDDNVRNEIISSIDDFPLWNPGKDKKDEKLFKNQLANKLTERILSVPRIPDRFRDIVKKCIVNMDFEDDGDDVDKETIIDKFVNKLKSVAFNRPACDIKYTHILRKEIIELLVELALKFDGDIVMLKKMANKLATEIARIPRNVNLSCDMTDLTDEFEENVCDWIHEHGLCGELKKDPKWIEGLARKLNKLKSQGIDDVCVIEKMREEIHQFVDDVGIAIETMDELIDELMKQLSNTVQTNEIERLNQNELTEVFIDWLSNLPGPSDLHPEKFEKIIEEIVKLIIEGRELGNENLANDIINYLVDAELSIDPADLGIHVRELMEKVKFLPSDNYHKEQVKKAMLKDIFDITENLTISKGKKEELRNRAHQIIENHLLRSSLNSKEAHDDVKESIMEDMDDAMSSIDIPKESRLKLDASLDNMLSSNLDKSWTRLRRLSRDGNNLKRTIVKDVKNAVKELPIDTDKKKDLMQQVKGTLSKNMDKPLPSNVKNTINDEICDIVERCPISEDNSIAGSLKKTLSAVAWKHLNICLPKRVCDIQNKVEKDVGIVIDRSSIKSGEKRELKKVIQDILTEKKYCLLSDEVLSTIKKDITSVISDLSITEDKKEVLKETVGVTISKDFNEALSSFRHDLNKIRSKLFEDICNIIEKSPISRDVKTHLISKLKSVLARNLDSSLSDEEKYTILDDVLNIVENDMPEEKRRRLTNKLAKKLDTQQMKDDTNELDQSTKNLKDLKNKILEHVLREMQQAVEARPIPMEKKIELKRKLKDIAKIDYKKPAEDIAEALLDDVNEILNELNFSKEKKNELKSELSAAINEFSKLLRELKDVETKYHQTKQRKSADDSGTLQEIRKALMHIEDFDENRAKESIFQGIEDIIEESAIPEETKMELKINLKKNTANYLKKPLSDVLDPIKIGIADILDDAQIPKFQKDKLKRALINMNDENVANMRDVNKSIVKESILQGIDKIIDESAIPEEKRIGWKKKLKKMATENLKKPFSDDVQDAIKISIADILDELQIPIPEKNKLKRALINMTNDCLENLREIKQPVEEVNETKAKENVLQGNYKIIEESAISEEKKMELKRKLNKMASDNSKMVLSDDVIDEIKISIADTLDDLEIPKSEKDKLKRALINMNDENVALIRDVDKTKVKDSILQGIEKIIKESAIPEKIRKEWKRKLKNMATDNLEKPFSDDVQDAIKIGIADILDELQIPKPEKNKLKRALFNMTNDCLKNLQEAKQPVEKVNETKENILQGNEKIVEKPGIPEEKNVKLKKKLKKMASNNLKKPFSDDVEDVIKISIADILNKLQIPESEKNKLVRASSNMVDENVDNLRETKQIRPLTDQRLEERVDETKPREIISQGIEEIIEESAIPEEKKVELKRKLKKMAADNLKNLFSDGLEDAIKIGTSDILDEIQIPKSEKNKLKRAIINITDENFTNLRSKPPNFSTRVKDVKQSQSKTQKDMLLGFEKAKDEAPIPKEKNIECKKKLTDMATKNSQKPLSYDVTESFDAGIYEIIDKLISPIDETNKLKSHASDSKIKGTRSVFPQTKKNIIDDSRENFRDTKQVQPSKGLMPIKEVDETNAKESILQGIEKIMDESAIPEGKKMEMKQKFKKMASDHLKKPYSDDVQDAINIGIADILDAINIGIADILDELQIPRPQKNKLKCALINMTNDGFDNLREAKQPLEKLNETKSKENILQGIDKTIEKSVIPEEKQMELKRKLKKMASDNLNKPFSDDVLNAIKISIVEIVDELQIPKSEKDKLILALINMTNKNVTNMRDVDETKTKNSILQEIENITRESAIPEDRKIELRRKLKKTATDHLSKPFSDDVQDAIKIGIADILDEFQIPKSDKSKFKRALLTMIDENVDDLRETKQIRPLKGQGLEEEIDVKKERERISQEIEKIIEESAIPKEKRTELKTKLQEMAADNLKKLFGDDGQDAIKIAITDILDKLQIHKSEKNKLKRALINMIDENLADLRGVTPILSKRVNDRETLESEIKKKLLLVLEKAVDVAPIHTEKKEGLMKKLKDLQKSDDFEESHKDGIHEIISELNSPKDTKSPLAKTKIDASDSKIKGTRSSVPQTKGSMVDDGVENFRDIKQPKPSKDLMPIEEVDETNAKEGILQGIDKIIEESAIPENKKMELKNKLKLAIENLKKPFTDDVQDAMKIGIADILDEPQFPNTDTNELKRAILNIVDKNVDNLRGVPFKLSSQVDDFKELESETQNNMLLGFENTIDEIPLPIDKETEFKKKLKDIATKIFQNSLSDDTAEELKDGMYEILDELNLPKAKKNKLKSELTAAVDENLSNLKNELNLTKSMPDAKRNKLNIIKRRVLPQFDETVNPSYQKQLAEEFDELLGISRTDGDLKDARRKLIKKIMKEQNLSEEEASAPVDELIGTAQEMALKGDMGDERYELDSSHVNSLEADINELVSKALFGGDFEDARRKLTKKLMQEQNLLEEEGSACTDHRIGKAQKLAPAAQSKEKSILHKEALANVISGAVDQSSMSKPDKTSFKSKLSSKLKQNIGKRTFNITGDLEPPKFEVSKDLKKYVDESLIPTDKGNELKSFLNEELMKTIDEIMDHYDDEEVYTKDYSKAIWKAVNKANIPNLEKSYLRKELVKTFDKIMDNRDEDKITKHKKAFSQVINDAVDKSSLSKPDKMSKKHKLLNKMEQTIDESPNINDTRALKAEVLKDCNNLVDASWIPIDKNNELKMLLKEVVMDDQDDEETFAMEESPEYEDKITKYEEAFSKAINAAVDQSILSTPDKMSLKNKLLNKMKHTIDETPHLNDTGDLKAEVLKDCKTVVDASSIPTGKTKELKILLKEEIMDDKDDEETLAMEDSPEYEDKITKYKEAFSKAINEAVNKFPVMDDYNESQMDFMLKKYKEVFARAINDAVNQSTLPKPDKISQKNKLLSKLNQTIDDSTHLDDVAALIAEVLIDSENIVDVSSILTVKKTELKLLLQEAMEEVSKELMDDEEVSRETFAMFKEKIAETVKTWMDSLPIDFHLKVPTAVAIDIAGDIVDRQKYLRVHPEAVSTDKDEIENLKYQIFRRIKHLVDPKDIPPIIEETKELYRLIMDIEPPLAFPKLRRLSLRGLVDHN